MFIVGVVDLLLGLEGVDGLDESRDVLDAMVVSVLVAVRTRLWMGVLTVVDLMSEVMLIVCLLLGVEVMVVGGCCLMVEEEGGVQLGGQVGCEQAHSLSGRISRVRRVQLGEGECTRRGATIWVI